MSKRKLLFYIDANAKTCGNCVYCDKTGELSCSGPRSEFGGHYLLLTNKHGIPLRHQRCLEAEVKGGE